MRSKKNTVPPQSATTMPLFKTANQMSKLCGIGENRLRELMAAGEIEYLQVGSHRLLCDEAVMDYYHRHKTPVHSCVHMDKVPRTA